ncbi:MAG: FHA domain-containing protein, partial [Candidatus Odinarchaeota archaeon]|nr:FHA domain-containing protein [Candidatus Odinarchaeota archaeon]
FDLSFDDNLLNQVSASILSKTEQIDAIFEDFKKQLLEKNKELSNIVASAVEYSLRDVYNQIAQAMEQINAIKDKQMDILGDILKEAQAMGITAAGLPQISITDIIDSFSALQSTVMLNISSLEQMTEEINAKFQDLVTSGVFSSEVISQDINQYVSHFDETVETVEKQLTEISKNSGLIPPSELEAIKAQLQEFKKSVSSIQEAIPKEGTGTIDFGSIQQTINTNLNNFKQFVSTLDKKFSGLVSEKLSLPSGFSGVLEKIVSLNVSVDQIAKNIEDLESRIPELLEKGNISEITSGIMSQVSTLESLINDFENKLLKDLASKGVDLTQIEKSVAPQLNEFKKYVQEIKEKVSKGEIEGSELQAITTTLKQKINDFKATIADTNTGLATSMGIGGAAGVGGVALATSAGGGGVSPTTFLTVATKIPGLLNRIKRSRNKLDEKFLSSYPLLAQKLDKKSIHVMSLVQLQMAQTSSRFDINYDPELYVHRPEELKFVSFIKELELESNTSVRNLFLVLADAGIGKTWLEAHIANEYVDKEYPIFFISLRLGFKSQIETIFNTDYFRVESILSKMYDITKKPVILFLDGLDEVPSSERSSILRYILSLGGRKDVAFVLSCRTVDWISDPAITDNLTTANRFIYRLEEEEEKETVASVILSDFTDEQIADACDRYGIPVPSGEMKKLARKPFILRLLSEFYRKHDRFPNVEDTNEIIRFIADPRGDSIFNRVGIRGYTRDLLFRLIDKIVETGSKEISLEEISDLLTDKESWARIISSGLVKQEERLYGTFIKIDEFYSKYLLLLALNRKRPSERVSYGQKILSAFPELRGVIKVPTVSVASTQTTVMGPPVTGVGAYKIRVKIGKSAPKELEIQPGEIKIYRNGMTGLLEADINGYKVSLGVSDFTVSRKHLLMKFDGKTFIVMDIGSKNGTFVNGRKIPINTPVEVQPGSEVRLGLGTTIKL